MVVSTTEAKQHHNLLLVRAGKQSYMHQLFEVISSLKCESQQNLAYQWFTCSVSAAQTSATQPVVTCGSCLMLARGPGCFDWKYPKIMLLSVPDTEKATLLQHSIVEHTLVPMLASSPKPFVCEFCREVLKVLTTEEIPDVVVRAVDSVREVCNYILQLASPGEVPNTELMHSMQQAKCGVKLTIRRAVLQCQAYAQAEKLAHETEYARKTFLPELTQFVHKLEAEPSHEAIQQVLAKLPLWDDRLPEGNALNENDFTMGLSVVEDQVTQGVVWLESQYSALLRKVCPDRVTADFGFIT
eukprot:6455367-Amphidinium_carterae.1